MSELSAYEDTRGYCQVGVSRDAKRKRHHVHRLVASAFWGMSLKDSDVHVNHLDGNKSNNAASNLAPGTQQENIVHGILTGLFKPHWPARKLTIEKAQEIRALWLHGMRQKDIARRFGICKSMVGAITQGKVWLPVRSDLSVTQAFRKNPSLPTM